MRQFSKNLGVNLFGQFSSATGLGVTARQTAQALLAAEIPLVCVDLASYYPTSGVADELNGFEALLTPDPGRASLPLNIYCIPVIDLPRLAHEMPQVFNPAKRHAAIVWWETTRLHPTWSEALMKLDAVVAYSDFISGVLANLLPLTPVLTGRQPLFVPADICADRAGFGLPEDATVFVTSFDPSGDPVRKNPLATIAAFRHAFCENEVDVRLVIRLQNAESTDFSRETVRLLNEAAADDRRIGFVLEPMSYRQVLSLYASADVFVSLHRAEGLGLGMMEAMRLGVPVIATGWSGNMSFMDHRCACLVRYRMIQVNGNHPFFKPEAIGAEAVWADPVIEDAIAWMRRLYRHPDECRRLGKAARQRVELYQQEALKLGWLHELAGIYDSTPMLPHVEGKFSAAAGPL